MTELKAVEAAFLGSAKIYADQSLGNPTGEFLNLSQAVAHRVAERSYDGWVRVDSQDGGSGGWLRASVRASEHLRALLPELDFLEGVVGFLNEWQRQDRPEIAASQLDSMERIKASFVRYRAGAGEEAAPWPLAMSMVIEGSLIAFQPGAALDDVRLGTAKLTEAVKLQPANGAIRNLAALAKLKECCASAGLPLLPNAEDLDRAWLRAISVEPLNRELLMNYQSFYQVLNETLAEHERSFVVMVHFDFDAVELSREAREHLVRIANTLEPNKKVTITVRGFADSTGDPAYNQVLSERRAQSVNTI